MSDSSVPALTTLPMRLLDARRKMVETGFYLGEPDLSDKVEWFRDGRTDHLVIKAQDAESHSGDSTPDDGSDKYPTPPPDGREPAPLCAVVRISARDYWLTADAGYRPSSIWKSFSTVKASCAAERPDLEPFKDDYITVSDNLRSFLEISETPGFQAKKGFFLPANSAGARFKVRHTLFDVRGEEDLDLTDDEDGEKPVSKDSEDVKDKEDCVFDIKNWPTYSDAARDALNAIKKTHKAVPVPAYDLSGHLIKPHAYRAKLEGALVELYFNLMHWSIGGRNGDTPSDTYAADIVMIRVLAAPHTASAPSPKKRRNVDLFVDPSQPPTKKLRRS